MQDFSQPMTLHQQHLNIQFYHFYVAISQYSVWHVQDFSQPMTLPHQHLNIQFYHFYVAISQYSVWHVQPCTLECKLVPEY